MSLACRDLWVRTTSALRLPNPIAAHWWEYMERRYSEPQRAYHTLNHLEELTQSFHLAEKLIQDKHVVAFTLFFHDIVYDPTSKTNEEDSAVIFEEFYEEAAPLGLAESFPATEKELVVQNILHTKNHLSLNRESVPQDTLVFLDMDLAILGSSRQRYESYAAQIRQEYIHVQEDDFVKGRSAFLNGLVTRDPTAQSLFATSFFRQRLAAQTAENIRWELDHLSRMHK